MSPQGPLAARVHSGADAVEPPVELNDVYDFTLNLSTARKIA